MRVLSYCAAALLVCGATLCVAEDLVAPNCELALIGPQGLIRAQLNVEIGERAWNDVWNDKFAALTTFYDRDGDGKLSVEEGARLPSPYALREVLSLGFTPRLGGAPDWKQLDADGDGHALASDVARYYRAHQVGGPIVGVGVLPHMSAFNATLVQLLDADASGKVDEKELRSAGKMLEKFDRNDDELIGAGELVAGVFYPGAAGSYSLVAPHAQSKPLPDSLAKFPAVLLPDDASDQHWVEVVIERADRDGNKQLSAAEAGLDAKRFAALDADQDRQLSATELAAWRSGPADIQLRLRMSKSDKQAPELVCVVPADRHSQAGSLNLKQQGLQLVARTDSGKLSATTDNVKERLEKTFADDDTNDNSLLDADELEKAKAGPWKSLLPILDRDNDQKIQQAELTAWLGLQAELAQGQMLLTLLDAGPGLFELLDQNHDGALGLGELRDAHRLAQDAGMIVEGQLNLARAPRIVLLTASAGYPNSPLGAIERTGPIWFLAMDRNLDGDVSRREFTGPAAAFEKLDTDGNKVLTAAEAAKVSPSDNN